MIGIVDYGVGNVSGVCQYVQTHEYSRAARFRKRVIWLTSIESYLPGVGSFDFAMSKLNESGLTRQPGSIRAKGWKAGAGSLCWNADAC